MTRREASEAWLRNFADRWNFHYPTMIEEASAESTDYFQRFITAHDIDLHSPEELGQDHAAFWKHLEIVTGRTFNQAHQQRFGWSCSC